MKRLKTNLSIVMVVLTVVTLTGAWVRWRPAVRFQYQPPQEHELRLLTWNVGYFAVADNKNARDVDLLAIAETIQETKAEVVVLQELGDVEQSKEIVRRLGERWKHHSTSTGHGTQLISVITTLTMQEFSEYEFGGRKVLAGLLCGKSKLPVYLVAVHSPHPARGIQDTVDNIRGAMFLAEASSEPIRIVAGDMNYNFDVDRTENDLYKEIMLVFGDGTSGLGETYLSHTRIDHVFHYPKDMEVIESGSGLIDLSFRFSKVPGFRDHRPIVVTYDLKSISDRIL